MKNINILMSAGKLYHLLCFEDQVTDGWWISVVDFFVAFFFFSALTKPVS